MQPKLSVREFLRFAAAVGFAAACHVVQGSEPGRNVVRQLKIGGGTIEIDFHPDHFDLAADRIFDWVRSAARAVVFYYGVFPVPRMRIRIESSTERTGVIHGTTWGSTLPFTRIFVGRHTRQEQLNNDWRMTHEMVHTAFPNVPDQHHWMEEGIATYVEPIARVQAGELDAAKIWADMIRGMPKGEPQAGDSGLDHTHTWGRTYWGGALFCLLADVQIRVASQNRRGLQQALRGIQQAGGTIEADWSIERAFAVGDKATGTGVLSKLYEEMKDKPMEVGLNLLWRKLGVQLAPGGQALFDSQAPWAAMRLAITTPIKLLGLPCAWRLPHLSSWRQADTLS